MCAARSYEEEVRLAEESIAPDERMSPTTVDIKPRAGGGSGGEGKDDSMRTHAAQIELDLQRTFPDHDDFRIAGKGTEGGKGGSGTALGPLRRILLALAHAHPEVGYTQGMNFVAGWCLLVLNNEEDSAYWLMAGAYTRPLFSLT
jgi:hypothetical protein